MLPVLGRPLLAYTFEQLIRAGVRRAVLACGYLPTQIRSHFGGEADGLAIRYRVEPEPLGTAGAIRYAAAGLDRTFLALNGDSLRDVDLRPLLEFHHDRGARATILLTEVKDPSRFGLVDVEDDGRVRGFREKPLPHEADGNLINAGVYVLEPDVVETIPEGRPVSIEREIFPALAREGSLYALGLPGYWLDVGTHESYLQAHLDLLRRQGGVSVHPSASIHACARLVAPAVVAAETVVEAGATVGPFAYVGEAATVGANAVVERAVVLPMGRVPPQGTARATIVEPESEPELVP